MAAMPEDKLDSSTININDPILILGAGRNIGLSLARRFVAERQRLILSYRSDPEAAIKLQNDFPDQVVATLPLHATTGSAMDRFFSKLEEHTDRIGAMINCIGPIHYGSILDASEQQVEEQITGNFAQAIWSIQRAVPLLRKAGGGRILLFAFSGVEDLLPYKKIGIYAAAKAALLSISKSLAKELEDDHIAVNTISPGMVNTPEMINDAEAHGFHSERFIPSDRIFDAASFLLSDEAANVTAKNITVSAESGWRVE